MMCNEEKARICYVHPNKVDQASEAKVEALSHQILKCHLNAQKHQLPPKFTKRVKCDPDSSSCVYFRLESPTRSLVMEAPKGVEINAEAGNMEATCRTELRLESKDGEVGVRGPEAQRDTAPMSQQVF